MRIVLTALLFLAMAMGVSGTRPKPEKRVDAIFAAYNKAGSPGCALGVIRNGNFIYRKGYGMGSLELGVPLSSQSVFYMGSVSKQFTAASVLLAAEKGFLSLDDDVHKYIPELPDYGQPVTLREMLHHSSGFPDVLGLMAVSGRNAEDIHSANELMDLIVRQRQLNFKPGDDYQYSNTNYFLLAEVVNRATKESLAEFATANIFKPLRMAHTRFFDDRTVIVPGRVAAYRPGTGGSFLVDWSTNYENVGGGGLMSTVDDLLLWDRNFYDNTLGKGTLTAELQTRGVFNNGAQNIYALGLILGSYRGLPTVEHGGGMFGYRTNLLRFPEQHFSVVLLCNVSNADASGLTHKVADIYLEKELRPVTASSTAEDPSAFSGKYFDRRMHYPITFTVTGKKLVLQGEPLNQAEASRFEDPISNGSFAFSDSKGIETVRVSYNNQVTFIGDRISDSVSVHTAALGTYAGTYKSTDLDATYTLSVEKENLTLRINRWGPATELQPIVTDEFDANGAMTIVFQRDATLKISSLTVFAGWDGWIRNEKFEKVQ
jgi:CubicO group peptidase (beta-lactamase class C family)